MRLYSGIDLHSTNSFLAIIDETGKRIFKEKLPNEIVAITERLSLYSGTLEGVVVESTYNWYWLVDGLMAEGYTVHLANPSAIQKYSGLIDPGLQYLIARTESLETGKLQFEPDTVYYVQQSPRMGWAVARVTLTPVSPDHLAEEIGENGCEEYVIDMNDIAEDLTDHEYNEAVTDYEREITEGFHKEFTDYKGFKAPQK